MKTMFGPSAAWRRVAADSRRRMEWSDLMRFGCGRVDGIITRSGAIRLELAHSPCGLNAAP
jgi:hypothetical protein